MLFTTSELQQKYKDYADAEGKIRRLVKEGKLISLKNGHYEDDKNIDPVYLAPWLCGPSYLSFDYALHVYDLIPETAYTYTSATFGKRKRKIFRNAFGTYVYQDVPRNVYPYGISARIEGPYSYHIATCEKALCDKLYSISPVRSIKGLQSLLFDDMRIYEDEFWALNHDDIWFLSPLYHSTNLDLLCRLIERGRK